MEKGWDTMKICGLQKTTLLDFPGHVAATIFTGGCNFRCPFCHNSDLLGSDAPAAFTDEEVLDFLKKLNREGNTIVMITHDSSIALEAERVVRIMDGRINFDGDVKEYAAII